MRIWIKSLSLSVAAAMLGWPALAQAPELAMLSNLTKGAWLVALRGEERERRVCISTGLEFIQLRHDQKGCSRFVIEDGAVQVTVQYRCRSDGFGHTVVRQEGTGLVQLRSQGFHRGTPFSIEGEARHIGKC